MTVRKALLLGAVTLAVSVPVDAFAQAPAAQGELVSVREMFRYPVASRSNPFMPQSGSDGGPRFEQLELAGIIFSTVAGQSLALITAPDGGHQLREGERLGNTTVVQILRDRVIVNTLVFDNLETQTMFLEDRRQGGTP